MVCPGCGEYSEEKEIDPAGPFAVCPYCRYRHPFVRLPLFVVSGASGSGKSTVCLALASAMSECVVMETDILWRAEFAMPEDNYHSYASTWMRVAMNVGQSGRPVALFGTALPDRFEDNPFRRYFTQVHYLALVCDDVTLESRLRDRPAWRRSDTDGFVEEMLRFNRWIKEYAGETEPPMSLLDTSSISLEESAEHTRKWLLAPLGDLPGRGRRRAE